MGFVERLVLGASFVSLGAAAATTSELNEYKLGNDSVPYVDVAQGGVRGFRDAHGNAVFLGVPYAASTGGENR